MDISDELAFMVPPAAMFLAHPAGESFDEFAFSSAGATLTKARNGLSPVHVEMITVIRMFIRQYGISPSQLQAWVEAAKAKIQQKKKVFRSSLISETDRDRPRPGLQPNLATDRDP